MSAERKGEKTEMKMKLIEATSRAKEKFPVGCHTPYHGKTCTPKNDRTMAQAGIEDSKLKDFGECHESSLIESFKMNPT